MSKVSYFKNIRQTTGGAVVELAEIYKAVKSGKWKKQVDAIRMGSGDKKTLPYFTVSGVFEPRNEQGMKQHSGRICLDIDKLECPEDVRDMIAQLPYCEFSALSVSGTGVFAVCRINPDEHKEAFLWLSRYVKQAIGEDVDKLDDYSRPRFVSYDPNAIIQDWATVFEMPQESMYQSERRAVVRDPLAIAKRMIADAVDGEKHTTLLRASRLLGGYVAGDWGISKQDAFNALYKAISEKGNVDSLAQAEKTINSGIAFGMNDPIKMPPVAESSAERVSEKATQPQAKEQIFSDRWDPDTAKKYKQQFLEDYLNEFFEFRYNEVLATVEFRVKGDEWGRLKDRHTHSILRDLRVMGYNFISKVMLDETIDSDFAPIYNPFDQYFKSLPKWDGKEYIKDLASTVKLQDESEREWFEEMLKRWMMAAVGCALWLEHINETILIFIGSQGDGKTRWLRKLIPSSLVEYQDKGRTKLDTKDAEMPLAECFFILFDELVSMRKNDIEAIKALTSEKQIRIRRSYARRTEVLMRRASFAGCDNNMDIINDPTGARRFLVFAIEEINHLHSIDIDKCWGEAKARFDKGEKYWLDKHEIVQLNDSNERYQIKSTEEELVSKYFISCDDGKDFYTATDVVRYINQEENKEERGLALPTGGISARKVGSILTKFFEKKKKKQNGRSVSGYLCTPSYKRGYEEDDKNSKAYLNKLMDDVDRLDNALNLIDDMEENDEPLPF